MEIMDDISHIAQSLPPPFTISLSISSSIHNLPISSISSSSLHDPLFPASIDISSFSFVQSLLHHSKHIFQTAPHCFFPQILNRINREDR